MTLADFYTEVLRVLKVVPPNGAALTEDIQRVEDRYPHIHAMLLRQGLVRWSVTENVPSEYVIPLSKIVAYSLSDTFSIPQEDMAKLRKEGSLFELTPSDGERQLRKMLTDEPIYYTPTAEYF